MFLSSLLDSLYQAVIDLGRKKYWYLIPGLFLLIVILINGIAIIPEEPYQRLSQNPFITRTDIHFNNYWQENPLLPIIAYYLNLTSPVTFNILCIIIFVGAYGLFTTLTYRHWGSTTALIFSTLLITSPLTTIILSWIGTPDGLTIAFTIPFLFSHSSVLLFFIAVLGITNHPTFIVAALEILLLRWVARKEINLKHILITIAGGAIGYGLVKLFIASNGIEVVSRFDFMQLKDFDEWAKINIRNLPASLFSFFNIHWLIFLVCLIMFFKKDKLFYSLALFLLAANFALTFFTLDTTRVYTLTSWGILFACIFHSYRLASKEPNDASIFQKQFLQALIVIGLVSFLTPRYFSWAGEIHQTPFYEFIRKVFRTLT